MHSIHKPEDQKKCFVPDEVVSICGPWAGKKLTNFVIRRVGRPHLSKPRNAAAILHCVIVQWGQIVLTWLFSTRDTLFQQEMYAFGYEAIKPSAGAESQSVHLKESFLFRERHPQ